MQPKATQTGSSAGPRENQRLRFRKGRKRQNWARRQLQTSLSAKNIFQTHGIGITPVLAALFVPSQVAGAPLVIPVDL